MQHLYYADLRQKVLRSRSRHQEALFFQLAASALQAELGDEEQQIQSREEGGERKSTEDKYRPYFLPEDYFPPWVKKKKKKVCVVLDKTQISPLHIINILIRDALMLILISDY